MMYVILLGGPGAGKGTQAVGLSSELEAQLTSRRETCSAERWERARLSALRPSPTWTRANWYPTS